jgi:hypothetical protein
VAGPYGHGNEPSGSINDGEFLELSILLVSEEGLCCLELFN